MITGCRTKWFAVAALALAGVAPALRAAEPKPMPDPQMKAVLDQLAELHPKPIEDLSAEEARKQPTPTDAVMALLKKEGKSTEPMPVGNVLNRTIPGTASPVPAATCPSASTRPRATGRFRSWSITTAAAL